MAARARPGARHRGCDPPPRSRRPARLLSVSGLEPLSLLFERDGLPRLELPDELRRLYCGDLGLPERCLYANFVATIDGVVAIPSLERSNVLIAGDSDADRFVMALLRALADAVIVGSGTLAASPTTRWRADTAFRPAAEALTELRRRLGLADAPKVAVVTTSGAIDATHPAVQAGALVLTTDRGATRLAESLPGGAEALVLPGEGFVDPHAAVDALRERGHERILTEGGPTFFASLVAAELVDELFLTVSPLLAGRSFEEGRLGLVEGIPLLPDGRHAGELLSVRTHGDHLFLRYRLG
jgi:riboflavin biosynthesis pyrimidine reductase